MVISPETFELIKLITLSIMTVLGFGIALLIRWPS